MRDIPSKIDGASTLTGPEYTSSQEELQNAVTVTGQSLDAAAGPDTDSNQLARAMTIVGQGAMAYSDGGAANTFVLTAKRTFTQPSGYTDGMTVTFTAAATNTGACTINVGGLGAVSFTRAGGTAYGSGDIVAGNFLIAQFQSATNRFEELANTTPDPAGVLAPDQIAIYEDDGSPTNANLTIVPGYVQPVAFSDQMVVIFKSNANNNGNDTHQINIVGLGSRNVVEKDGGNPVENRFTVDDWVMCVFREVRNAFEIAFVYSKPEPTPVVGAIPTTFNGILYNLEVAGDQLKPTEYIDGMVVIFQAPQTNTAGLDINIEGIGNRDLRKIDGTNFSAGEVTAGLFITARYDLSLDQFRATTSRLQTFQDIHRTGTAARSSGLVASTFGPSQTVNLAWQTPDFDDLGFYDSANDRFQVPAGQNIERVDISLNLRIPTNEGDNFSVEINQSGTAIGIDSANAKENSEGVSIALNDVPVTAGDVFNAELNISAVQQRTVQYANMSIRATKFS